jgi:Uma2 family endonuclease
MPLKLIAEAQALYDTARSTALMIDLTPVIDEMTDEQFFQFCVANPDLRIERKANGEIVIMAPEGGVSGSRNSTINADLNIWTRRNGTGVAFTSSAGFRLPNGATYGPDAAWVRRERLLSLSRHDKERFLPLCPDFVIELRSASDRLRPLKAKMQEYIANGALLGWLIDPDSRSVYVYRPDRPVEHLQSIVTISGDPELPGFVLDLAPIWEPGF